MKSNLTQTEKEKIKNHIDELLKPNPLLQDISSVKANKKDKLKSYGTYPLIKIHDPIKELFDLAKDEKQFKEIQNWVYKNVVETTEKYTVGRNVMIQNNHQAIKNVKKEMAFRIGLAVLKYSEHIREDHVGEYGDTELTIKTLTIKK